MAITMEDVARHVGVAKSTVSLALNNKPGVSDELRETILNAAQNLGYRLAKRKTSKPKTENKSIAVVHGEHQGIDDGPTVLYLKYLEGIQTYFEMHNINFSMFANYREEPQNLTFHLLNRNQFTPDGFILMGSVAKHDGQLVQQLLEQNIPVVVLSRNWSDLPISTVSQDHVQQTSIALNHLFKLGHRNIGFVAQNGDRQCDWYDWRLSCYEQMMLEHTGKIDETLVSTAQHGAEATKTLLQRRTDVTAIFAINDQRALEVLQGLRDIGRQVPQDISVIGVDDAFPIPDGFPALTTVTFPHIEVGYLAAELLIKHIENQSLSHTNIIVQSELVERETCRACL